MTEVSYSCRTPANWVTVPVGTKQPDLAPLLAVLPGADRNPQAIRRLKTLTRAVHRDLRRAGVRSLAAWFETDLNTSTTLAAYMSVAIVESSSLGGEEGEVRTVTPSTILAALGLVRSDPMSSSYRLTEPPDLADLPIGRVAHRRGLVDMRSGVDRSELVVFNEQFFLPIDAGHQVAVLSLSTPCYEDAAAFSRLFRRIATSWCRIGDR